MKAKTFIIGVGTGLVAGAAAVLFTTPQSGKELKLSLKERKLSADQLKNDFKQRFEAIKDAVNTIKVEAKTTLPETLSSIKGSIEQFQEDTAPTQQRIMQHIEELQKAANDISNEIEEFQNRKTSK